MVSQLGITVQLGSHCFGIQVGQQERWKVIMLIDDTDDVVRPKYGKQLSQAPFRFITPL